MSVRKSFASRSFARDHAWDLDDNGNMTADDQGDTLVYDAWNRLVEVTNAGGILIAAYTYDGLGRRITRTDGYSLQNLLYDTSDQLLEAKTGTTVNATYVWSATYIDGLVSRAK